MEHTPHLVTLINTANWDTQKYAVMAKDIPDALQKATMWCKWDKPEHTYQMITVSVAGANPDADVSAFEFISEDSITSVRKILHHQKEKLDDVG